MKLTSEPADTDEEPRLIGPLPSGAWHVAHRRLLDEQAASNNAIDTEDFVSAIQAKAEREIARWSALPCVGEIERLSACAEPDGCPERDHVMCPRRRVARLSAEETLRKAERRKELEEAGMAQKTLRAVFDADAWETDAVLGLRNALRREQRPTIVVLQGGVGCGKTCAAASWALKTGARWLTAKALSRMGYEAELEKLGRAPNLVLDDLGTEYLDAKGFFVSTLDGLIDDRYSRELPTVITTNVPAEEFKARYGERIVDRIREVGVFVQVGGQSLRSRRGLKVLP